MKNAYGVLHHLRPTLPEQICRNAALWKRMLSSVQPAEL
uniref:Uncharacterized protein n=1 Tax=Arundo donax TaxID=35708 RepID=A0A0A8XRK0_ARUDO